MAHTSKTHQTLHANRRNIVSIVIAGLFLYVLVPQVGALRTSLPLLKHANRWWLIVAIVAALATYLPATLNYVILAQKPLRYVKTLLVQIAAGFVNHLLPSGIGALGVNYLYLRRERHTQAAAGTIIFMNNALGTAGLVLLLLVFYCIHPALLRGVHIPHVSHLLYWLLGVCIIIVLIAIIWFQKLWIRIRHMVVHIRKSLRWYRTRPLRIIGGLASSLLITVCFTVCLYASAKAIGVQVSLVHALFMLTLSLIGATVVPTPGGLGGAEAGLFVGLVAYGATDTTALATTLLYRLLTYWLALGVGAVVTVGIRGKAYF